MKLKFSQAKRNINRQQTRGLIIGKSILILGLLLTTMIKCQNILLNSLRRLSHLLEEQRIVELFYYYLNFSFS